MTQWSVPSLTPVSIQKTQRMKLQANFSPCFSSTSFTAWVFISFHHIKINVTFDIYCVFFPLTVYFSCKHGGEKEEWCLFLCCRVEQWSQSLLPYRSCKLWDRQQNVISWGPTSDLSLGPSLSSLWRLDWHKVNLKKTIPAVVESTFAQTLYHFYSTTTTSKTHLKSSWLLRHFNL